jgi:dihydrofolate synthase/folylpolyglutamate synthase
MIYSAAIAFLYGLQKHGIKLGLENMRALTARIGHPERRLRVLHIGGTNGKGSTAAMAAAMLQAAGYRVGLYTSPHLVEFRERIRVDGVMISEERVAALTDRLRTATGMDLIPTFFELTTAMALLHFAESAVDVAVLEVGLGGRFDATNVVEPVACAITTIAQDHQDYLGHTERAIAFEKAGIIKPAVPVVLGRINGEAFDVIAAVAAERAAPMVRFGRSFHTEGTDPACFAYRGAIRVLTALTCALAGQHQVENAACAIALLESGRPAGLSVAECAIRSGLRSVVWEGRLETVGRNPVVLLDGAHNPAAADVLAQYLRAYRIRHPTTRIVLVFGMMRDKDHGGFLEPLRDVVSEIVLTQADISRAATVQELQFELGSCSVPLHKAPVPAEALSLARQLASTQDVICVTGSLMLVGEVKAAMRGCGLSPLRG